MRKWVSELLYRLADWLSVSEEREPSEDLSPAALQYRAEFLSAFSADESFLRGARETLSEMPNAQIRRGEWYDVIVDGDVSNASRPS